MLADKKFLNGKVLSSRVYPELFPIGKDERVINIGCGDGPQAFAYDGSFKEMVGVDINSQRLQEAKRIHDEAGLKNYSTICANVESIPLESQSFDKAIAIDIIEHVNSPEGLCREARRLIKDGGELLITFPAMHDRYVRLFSWIGRAVFGRKKKQSDREGWNPDDHNHEYPPDEWIRLVSACGFKLKKSRATTMFPPLHLYGVPKFWFSNQLIHFLDSWVCRLPIVKNAGQSLACVFVKV